MSGISYDPDNNEIVVTDSVLPDGAATEIKQDDSITQQTSANTKLDTLNTNVSKEAKQDTQITNQGTLNTRVGDLTEAAPASDTASSGLNGRLQRIAQRISSFITGLTDGDYQIKLRGNSDGTLAGNNKDTIKTSDSLNGSGVQGTLSVGTSAVELKVGASKLANRKTCGLANTSNTTIYWGYTNAVTTSNGRPIYKNQNDAEWSANDSASIWLIAGSAGNTVRINESE